jgi:hypothetical protein
MRTYKIRPGAYPEKEITSDNFEKDTRKKKPYYINEDVQYAICPRCDNPIQIIGLYKKLAVTEKPYGRHVPKDIPKLARYDQEAYDYCPLANPQKPRPDARRKKLSDISRAILRLLRDEFDRVVYILSQDTGIDFSDNLLREMLRTFIAAKGFLYPWATNGNLPWMFGYMAHSKPLFGQRLVETCTLRKNILAFAPNAVFSERGYLTNNGGYLDPIQFCFMHHKFENNGHDETLKFLVSQSRSEGDVTLHEEILHIDQRRFLNLLAVPAEKAKRNLRHLKLAREEFDKSGIRIV